MALSRKKIIKYAVFPHRIAAGIAIVMLAVIWFIGNWSPDGPYFAMESPRLAFALTTLVFAAYALVAGVIAAGFFHAASKHTGRTFNSYRNGSFWLMVVGMLFLFPVPIMSLVLGGTLAGRALALIIVGISMSSIIFGRARIQLIEEKLREIYIQGLLIPFEEIEQLGETQHT